MPATATATVVDDRNWMKRERCGEVDGKKVKERINNQQPAERRASSKIDESGGCH
jgi:hypothetical protein